MQDKNRVPHPPPPKQGSGVVKYQCCRITITNYLVGGSALSERSVQEEQRRYLVLEIELEPQLNYSILFSTQASLVVSNLR